MLRLIIFFIWVSGVIIAKGFWSTLIALFVPFWAWYLVIEFTLKHFGIV